jgi:hypothetical protein
LIPKILKNNQLDRVARSKRGKMKKCHRKDKLSSKIPKMPK